MTGLDATAQYRYGYTPMGQAYGFKHRYSDEQMTRTFSSHSPNRNVVQNLYTGKYAEPLTGLANMDARWYDAQKGRFIQGDQYNHANLMLPAGAQSELMRYIGRSQSDLLRDPAQQMRYGYVSGNALRWVDPLGLCPDIEPDPQWTINPNAPGNYALSDVVAVIMSTPTGRLAIEVGKPDIKMDIEEKGGHFDKNTNTIHLNKNLSFQENVQTLAHEVGHPFQQSLGENQPNPYELSKEDYVTQRIENEVVAENVRHSIYSELEDKSKMKKPSLQSEWESAPEDSKLETIRERFTGENAVMITGTTGERYDEYYGNIWNRYNANE